MSSDNEQRAAGLHYEERGGGDPIVWLHGFGSSIKNWDGIVPAFAGSARPTSFLR